MSAASSLPEGTVTFVFTDIEGSTRLLTEHREAYPELLARHHAIIRRALADHSGTEVKTEGDAFFAVFTKAADAIAFAADAQRELHATDFPASAKVLVRMGIHTGEGALSDGDYVGLDVHRAARIAAAGHGGQVLVSEATRALAGDSLPASAALRDLGEHKLKDLPAPIRLYQLVLDGLNSDFAPVRSLGRGNLPETLTSFIGREREVDRVSQLLDEARLVTLTGPGGTGKTRLSIEVARHVQEMFLDGAWFVPLEEITDPDLVPPAIARVMGVKEEATRPPIESLVEALAQRHALIVLDNFEQVVDAARHINRLLRDAPAPRILCSSREALHIGGEQEFPVPPLDDEPAARLFVQRALQLRPDFVPNDEDLATIADICRAVDRLPLAIELAAARSRMFPLPTLLTRLTEHLTALESSRRDLPDRQRTLRGAIEWSWELLDDTEREVFGRLAVFSGGADLAAIEAVIDPGGEIVGDVIGVLGSLVDKSLVFVADGPGGGPRYRMLDTIHAFAAEMLAASPGASALRERHVAYFMQFAEAIEPQLTGALPEMAFARTEAEDDNLRAAIIWSGESGKTAAGFRIGGAIWRFWQHRGRLREGRALLEQLIALAADVDPDARGRGMTGYGGIVYWQGEYEHAEQVYAEALALYRQAGDEHNAALALFDLGFTMSVNRKLAEASATLAESEQLYGRLGDEKGRLMVAEGRAAVALIARDLALARHIAEVVVEDYRRLGMRYRFVDTMGLLIGVYLEQGELRLAQDRWEDFAAAWLEFSDYSARVLVFEFGARMAYEDGRPRDAARMLGALQQMRDRSEPMLTPSSVMGMRDVETDVRAALSGDEFDAAFAEGHAWPPDAATTMALELGKRHSVQE